MKYLRSKDGINWFDNKKNDIINNQLLSNIYIDIIGDYINRKDFKLINISTFEEENNISFLINYRIGLEHKQIRYQKELVK